MRSKSCCVCPDCVTRRSPIILKADYLLSGAEANSGLIIWSHKHRHQTALAA